MDFRGKKYERGSNWSDPEVVELLQLWANDSVQMELESCLRNQHVFNRIAEVLREKGIHRTGDQCREKIKKMKLEYRRIKDNQKIVRGGRAWKFYEVMDRVLTNRPSLSYGSLGGSVIAQQVLQGAVGMEGYHLHAPHLSAFGSPPSGAFIFGHPPKAGEMTEIKCEEIDSDEPGLTPEPPPELMYHVGSGDEPEGVRELGLEQQDMSAAGIREDGAADVGISPTGFSERNVACLSGAGSAGGTGAPPGSSLGTIPRLRKRRKAGRPRESLDEALVRFLSSQRAAEERFLALEECRLQREAEAEERRAQLDQRRAEMERQHEFRMFSVFAHMVSALRPDSSSVSSPHFGRARREEEDVAGHSWAGADSQKPSPYLSRRGNLLRDYEDILQEGFVMYSKDKHDEDKNPTGIINLGTSENKLCFDLLSKRLTQSDMFQIDPPLLQYGDWKGHSFLREEVARFLSYYCKAPSPLKVENVVVLNGCTSTFSAVAAVICDPEDAILIPTPSYGAIARDVFLYSNVRTVHVHLESEMSATDERPFQLTVEKMEKALEEATLEGIHVKAVVFINPHNPLGEIYTPAEMMQFLEFAKRHKLHVFVDEIYMLSVFDEDATFHSVLSFNKLPDPQRTHVMWGMTKDFAVCGMRVGCLYTENQDVIGAMEPLAVFHGIPGTTQHQAAQLLHDRDWINQVYLPTNRGRLKAAHQYVVNELKALDIPFLDRPAGFFIWTDFRKFLKEETPEEEIALWRHFLNNKILLSCGKAFDCCQPGWFRVVFADKTYRLQLGMQRLRKALEELRKNDLTKDLKKKNNQTEDPKRSRQSDGRLKSGTSEDRSWLSPPEDTKQTVLASFDHILGSGVDDIMQVSCQSQPTSSGLDNLIEILKQQMRSSDWLQKNTPELFAQENPEVFDVYVKLREKPKDEDLEAKGVP